jgi:hypothetical protein
MKKDLNEEIYKMRTMMGLNEQKFLDKVKAAAQNVGSKIQSGVNQVAQTIADKTKPQQQTTQQPQQISQALKEYNEFVDKWKVVNNDLNSNKVFIEGNDNGFNDSYSFEVSMKMDAIRIYSQRYMQQHPEIKTMSNKFNPPTELDRKCYLKPNEKGNTITYCAFVFELKLK